jgi:hypothetical protein
MDPGDASVSWRSSSALALTSLLAASVLGLALAGCGDDRAADAESEVREFQAALARHDGVSACERLATPTRAELVRGRGGGGCEGAILGAGLPASPPPIRSQTFVDSAFVELADHTAYFLDLAPDGGWWISAGGCVPTGADLPYDCELES